MHNCKFCTYATSTSLAAFFYYLFSFFLTFAFLLCLYDILFPFHIFPSLCTSFIYILRWIWVIHVKPHPPAVSSPLLNNTWNPSVTACLIPLPRFSALISLIFHFFSFPCSQTFFASALILLSRYPFLCFSFYLHPVLILTPIRMWPKVCESLITVSMCHHGHGCRCLSKSLNVAAWILFTFSVKRIKVNLAIIQSWEFSLILIRKVGKLKI